MPVLRPADTLSNPFLLGYGLFYFRYLQFWPA